MYRRVVKLMFTDIPDVRTALMIELVRTSETSVNINLTTRRYIPEDSKRYTRCRENL
jgi:hypothetical protein